MNRRVSAGGLLVLAALLAQTSPAPAQDVRQLQTSRS